MWDPVLLIAQIISLQSLHYLTLSLILPPLLYTFTDSRASIYTHGGSVTVGMVMDWREMAGRSTLQSPSSASSFVESATNQFWSWLPSKKDDNAFWFLGHGDIDAHVDPSNNKVTASRGELGGWRLSLQHSPEGEVKNMNTESKKTRRRRKGVLTPREDDQQDGSADPLANPSIRDPLRSWVISAGWLVASGFDIYIIYSLIRRPTMVLDFSLTLILSHTILTTYYASSFPTSLFFWLIMSIGALLLIVFAEQLCVRRELRQGLKPVTTTSTNANSLRDDGTRSLMQTLGRRRNIMGPSQEELFNANLEHMRHVGGGGDDEGDLNLDLDDEHGHEQIELVERGIPTTTN